MKNVRKTIVTVAAMTVMMLFVTETAAPESPSTFFAPPFFDLLAHLLDDVVLALEEPEPAASMGQVVHVAGSRLGEAVDLVDQLRNERRANAGNDDQHQQIRDHDRRRARDLGTPLDQARRAG